MSRANQNSSMSSMMDSMTMRDDRFSPPVIPPGRVKRTALIRQLNTLAQRRILFIQAPAGSGKTTLVCQWLQETRRTALWITLDEFCCRHADILEQLLRGLKVPVPDGFTNHPLSATLHELEQLTIWPQAMVLDDCHLCPDAEFAAALPMLRARIPAQTALILMSRQAPHITLEEYASKGLVVRIKDLALSTDEIMQGFRLHRLAIPEAHAELLRQHSGGWATAFTAVLKACENSQNFDTSLYEKSLHDLLKCYVFPFWQDIDLLKKCSICDTVSQQLCNLLTGRDDGWEVLRVLADRTGLVVWEGADHCRFHALLKEYLETELRQDDSIEKPPLYRLAAQYYHQKGDILRAIDMANKSGYVELLEQIIFLVNEDGEMSLELAAYVGSLAKTLRNIPDEVAAQSPRMASLSFMLEFALGNAEKACYWLDVCKTFPPVPEHAVVFALRRAVDPRVDSWELVRAFQDIQSLVPAARSTHRFKTLTMTYNMPFFHKAPRDYTDAARDMERYFPAQRQALEPVMGAVYLPLGLCVQSGLLYECCRLDEAEALAREAVNMVTGFPPAVQFCVYALYYEVLRVQGKPIDWEQIGGVVSKAQYLAPNYLSYRANAHLAEGCKMTAAEWLRRTDIPMTIKFYELPQNYTTARSLMVLGRLEEAARLLEKLAEFTQSYSRHADFLEAVTLLAVSLWRQNRQDAAIQTFIPAIVKAQELRILMPVAKEGTDILPVLQKVQARLKHGYDTELLDKGFVSSLLLEAQKIARHYGGLAAGSRPRKLSAKQLEVLEYLKQGLTYQEISERMGVKITTVRDHIGKLYEKLGVSSATDAILMSETDI